MLVQSAYAETQPTLCLLWITRPTTITCAVKCAIRTPPTHIVGAFGNTQFPFIDISGGLYRSISIIIIFFRVRSSTQRRYNFARTSNVFGRTFCWIKGASVTLCGALTVPSSVLSVGYALLFATGRTFAKHKRYVDADRNLFWKLHFIQCEASYVCVCECKQRFAELILKDTFHECEYKLFLVVISEKVDSIILPPKVGFQFPLFLVRIETKSVVEQCKLSVNDLSCVLPVAMAASHWWSGSTCK